MKKYECVLFDLDGTLVNTYEGIFNSYKYAAEKMNLPLPTDKLVNEVIGAKLTDVFKEKFNLVENDVEKAISFYRSRYAEKGIYEAEIYPEIKELLQWLKNHNIKVGVTTLKKQSFAIKMLEKLGLTLYFDIILGMDENDKLTKKDIVLHAVQCLAVNREKTILVGDSIYDAVGAAEAGVDFVGVSYGFGLKPGIGIGNALAIVDLPLEIVKYIL